MSGSLQLRGDLGQFISTTASNALLNNKSSLTFSGFFKVSDVGTGGSVNIWTCSNLLGFNFKVTPTFTQYGINILGVSGNLEVDPALPINAATHFMMTLNATGTSFLYVNGSVVGQRNNISVIQNVNTAIKVGWDQTGTHGTVLIRDFAIWSGTQLPQSSAVNLRDGRTTPATELTPATSWWTLQGASGLNPTISDSGMKDSIGSNDLISITNSSNAFYSSDPIQYLPQTTIIDSHVTKCGKLLQVFIGSNPAFGTTSPAYPTAISTNPIIQINGSSFIPSSSGVQGPLWSNTLFEHPYVFYRLPFKVSPTDIVQLSTVDQWITTALGNPGPQSLIAKNYVGQNEPGVFTYPGMDAVPNTLKVGYNVSGGTYGGGGLASIFQDTSHTFAAVWNNTTSSTPNGYPISISQSFGRTANTPAGFPGNQSFNGVDTKLFPNPTGVYSVIADEMNPANPMTVNMTMGANAGFITGPTITGSGLNKRWDWIVSRTGIPSTWTLGLQFTLTTPDTVSGLNTLLNFKSYNPLTARPINPGLAINDNLIRTMTANTSGVYIACTRGMELTANGSDGLSSMIIPSDMPPPCSGYGAFTATPVISVNDWIPNNPTFSGNRYIPIWFTRPYDLNVTPYIYSEQQWVNFLPATGGFSKYYTAPSSHGLGFDWFYPSGVVANNPSVIMEFVTGLSGVPINHNLYTGQFISFVGSVSNIHVSSAIGVGVASVGGTVPVFVTSPSSFLFANGATTLPAGPTLGNVTSGQLINLQASLIQYGDSKTPIEIVNSYAKAIGGNAFWLAIPQGMADTAVTVTAQRILPNHPPNGKLYVEWSNEILIPNFQYGFNNGICRLQGFTPQISALKRANEIGNIFSAIWASGGRNPSDIIKVFQPFTPDAGAARSALIYAQASSIAIDAVAIAIYESMDSSTTYKNFAASLDANNPDSIANTGNGGNGIVTGMDEWHDMYKMSIKYSNSFNGPGGYITLMSNAIRDSSYGTGIGFSHAVPKIIGYECSPTQSITTPVSLTNKLHRGGLTHDSQYHTTYYDVMTSFLQSLQQPGPSGSIGMDLTCIESLAGIRQADGIGTLCLNVDPNKSGTDGACVAIWGYNMWEDQIPGYGNNNKFYSLSLGGDLACHDIDNQNVAAQAISDWVFAQNGFSNSIIPAQSHLERNVKYNKSIFGVYKLR